MNLWHTRERALAALKDCLLPEAAILRDTFALVDECVRRLETLDSEFGRICALTLVKARNLALGCYSLSLDNLGQESGALCRPLIEAFELLVYFRLEPARTKEALGNRLPKPGKRAEMIKGWHQDLREHFNKHASHLSVSFESMGHLIDFNQGTLKITQPQNEVVLRCNLHSLLAILLPVAVEAVNCVSIGSSMIDETLVDRVNVLRKRYRKLVGIPIVEMGKGLYL